LDAFKITCVTCTARLSVRDEKLIGQILACPKCGSMVQVTPPVREPSPVAKAAVVAAPVAPAAPSVATSAVFDEPVDVGAPQAAPAAPVIAAPPVPSAPAAMAPMKLAAILAGGALVGSGVVAIALSWLSPEQAAVAPQLTTPVAPATVAPPSLDEPTIEPDAPTAPAEAVVSGEALADAAESGEVVAPVEVPAASSAEETEARAAAVEAAPAPIPSGELDATVRIDAAPSEPSPATPRLRIDPLDLDPEGLDMTTLLRPETAAPAPSVADQPPAPPVASAAPAEVREAPPAARRTLEPATAPNVAALLKRKLASVKVDRMPLCRFLDVAVQISGLPVSVAPAELEMARVSAATTVSVEAQEATIEELLTAALGPLRLAPRIGEAHIALVFADGDRRRELVYPIDDLVRDDDEARRLADDVQRLVAPESWQAAGGDGLATVDGRSLRVEQTERVQYQTLLALERYRLARGLPTRSKYPVELLGTRSAEAGLAKRLAGKTTFTFSDYTPLREVVRYWQEELAAPVLVDWPALAEARLWPQSRVVTSAVDLPWSTALDQSLAPLELAWRSAGGRAIEITTLAKVQNEPRLAIYPLKSDADVTNETLTKKIGELATEAAASGSTAEAYFADHRVLLVRRPASVQRALAAWLNEQGLLAGE